MGEESLSVKAREALKHLRSLAVQFGRVPSVRDLMAKVKYKSPRSAMLLMDELKKNSFLEKKADGSYKMIKDLSVADLSRTISK